MERDSVGLGVVAREWGRIGCIGFGGPPAHIALLRDLCVERRRLDRRRRLRGRDRRRATSCPGRPRRSSPSTAHCACGGRPGALVGGLCFIVPGLVLILALAAAVPRRRARRRGARRGRRARALPSPRSRSRPVWVCSAELATCAPRGRWLVYIAARCAWPPRRRRAVGGARPARLRRSPSSLRAASACRDLAGALARPLLAAAVAERPARALAWVGAQGRRALYGGGFVIIPLMQDRRRRHPPLDDRRAVPQRRGARAGHARPRRAYRRRRRLRGGGVGGGCSRPPSRFAPSFAFVLVGAAAPRPPAHERDGLARSSTAPAPPPRRDPGRAIPLALALTEGWQVGVLAAAAVRCCSCAAVSWRRCSPRPWPASRPSPSVPLSEGGGGRCRITRIGVEAPSEFPIGFGDPHLHAPTARCKGARLMSEVPPPVDPDDPRRRVPVEPVVVPPAEPVEEVQYVHEERVIGDVPPVAGDVDVNAVHEEERVRVLPDGTVLHERDRIEQRSRFRDWLPWLLLALVGLILAIGLILWYVIRSSTKTVPAVVGLRVDAAVSRLQQDGFKTEIVRQTNPRPGASSSVRTRPRGRSTTTARSSGCSSRRDARRRGAERGRPHAERGPRPARQGRVQGDDLEVSRPAEREHRRAVARSRRARPRARSSTSTSRRAAQRWPFRARSAPRSTRRARRSRRRASSPPSPACRPISRSTPSSHRHPPAASCARDRPCS